LNGPPRPRGEAGPPAPARSPADRARDAYNVGGRLRIAHSAPRFLTPQAPMTATSQGPDCAAAALPGASTNPQPPPGRRSPAGGRAGGRGGDREPHGSAPAGNGMPPAPGGRFTTGAAGRPRPPKGNRAGEPKDSTTKPGHDRKATVPRTRAPRDGAHATSRRSTSRWARAAGSRTGPGLREGPVAACRSSNSLGPGQAIRGGSEGKPAGPARRLWGGGPTEPRDPEFGVPHFQGLNSCWPGRHPRGLSRDSPPGPRDLGPRWLAAQRRPRRARQNGARRPYALGVARVRLAVPPVGQTEMKGGLEAGRACGPPRPCRAGVHSSGAPPRSPAAQALRIKPGPVQHRRPKHWCRPWEGAIAHGGHSRYHIHIVRGDMYTDQSWGRISRRRPPLPIPGMNNRRNIEDAGQARSRLHLQAPEARPRLEFLARGLRPAGSLHRPGYRPACPPRPLPGSRSPEPGGGDFGAGPSAATDGRGLVGRCQQ